jgi:hypothetical protein
MLCRHEHPDIAVAAVLAAAPSHLRPCSISVASKCTNYCIDFQIQVSTRVVAQSIFLVLEHYWPHCDVTGIYDCDDFCRCLAPRQWVLKALCRFVSDLLSPPSSMFCCVLGGAPQTVSRLLAVRGVSTLKMGKPKADTHSMYVVTGQSRSRAGLTTLCVGKR